MLTSTFDLSIGTPYKTINTPDCFLPTFELPEVMYWNYVNDSKLRRTPFFSFSVRLVKMSRLDLGGVSIHLFDIGSRLDQVRYWSKSISWGVWWTICLLSPWKKTPSLVVNFKDVKNLYMLQSLCQFLLMCTLFLTGICCYFSFLPVIFVRVSIRYMTIIGWFRNCIETDYTSSSFSVSFLSF